MEQAPKVRIVSGKPATVEHDVNELLEHYTPLVWNIQSDWEGVIVTCIMVHESEVRKAQLAAMQMGGLAPNQIRRMG